MHNCKTAHPKKSHRRRNRALKKALAPKRSYVSWAAGTAVAPKRVRVRRIAVDAAKVPATGAEPSKFGTMRESGRRVEIYQPSAIRRAVAGIKRFVPFTRKSG